MVRISIPTEDCLEAVADRFGSVVPTYGVPEYAHLGVGAQVPAVSDTSLDTAVPINYTAVDDCDVTTGWSATTDGAVALNTTSGEYIEGVGCLNIQKTGTTQTSVTYSKTTTSVDFTSKTLWTWYYNSDVTTLAVTTAVEVRFGSDSSNYYYKRYDRADLDDGGNMLSFTSATATGTTGTPVIASCDYYAIVCTYTATSVTRTTNTQRLDHLLVATVADYRLEFSTGYPLVNVAAQKVTSVGIITTPQAVGHAATNTGWFLSSGHMYGVDQFNADTKTQTEEWEFTEETGFQFML